VTVSGSPKQVPDFIGTQTAYALYGFVKTTSGGGMEGVDIHCSGPGLNKTVPTSVSGYYSCDLVDNGTYTITPSKPGWEFDPPDQIVTVSGSPKRVPASARLTRLVALRLHSKACPALDAGACRPSPRW
jgi:hypothetical protein